MAMTNDNGSLYTTIQQRIATLEFGHSASNSLPINLLDRLTKELHKLSENKAVTTIVLKSEGERAFCAGASFDELIAVTTIAEGTVFFSGFANLINAMRTCKKIIIGRVQGKTVGGGLGIIAACDYVFATEAAAIKLSEISIGIAPFVIAPALERKMGVAALSELSLAPTDWQNAYWAKEKGLFSRVFETTADMDTALQIFTEKTTTYNLEALTAWKKVLWNNTAHWQTLLPERAAITGQLTLSSFTKNALSKYKK